MMDFAFILHFSGISVNFIRNEGKNSSHQPLPGPSHPCNFSHSPQPSIFFHKNVVLLFFVVVFYLGDGQFELQDKKSLSAFRIR